jgi:small ligand-binding sensory domain FIST
MRGDDSAAWAENLAELREHLGGAPPDLCCLFVAREAPADGLPSEHAVVDALVDLLQPRHLVGCGASGVLGGGREIENAPAIAVLVGHLEGARLRCAHIDADAIRDGAFPSMTETASALVFADPWTCDGDTLLAELDRVGAGRVVVGGLASGTPLHGGAPIFCDGSVLRGGCAILEIDGGSWFLDTVVAQGCRPIGQPLFVTDARDEWVLELDGRPALQVLRELAQAAPEKDRALLGQSLFLGIEMHSERASYGRGDFLIRNLVGANPNAGAIAVAARPKTGQVVQFHLRDAETSADDLETQLTRYRGAGGSGAEAALLFSCIGRGEQLYGQPNHDSNTFLRTVGGIPLCGFFCNGEIGPVGGRTFLHAYTSAFAMFRRRAGRQ